MAEAEVYVLDRYRRSPVDRADQLSTSITEGEYQVTLGGEAKAVNPLPLQQYAGSGDERTKYLSKGEELEWSPDLLSDHSWRETRRRTTYETVAESGTAEIEKWRLMLDLFRHEAYPHAEDVAERLRHLHEIEPEDDEEPISLDSVAMLLSFLVPFTSKAQPAITVTPDGNIYATWKAEGGRHCGVEFTPARSAKLVLMVPGDADTGAGIHIAGRMGTSELERTLRLHGIHIW
jgi:hypothetical protein